MHNFKKILQFLVCVGVLALVIWFFDKALYPCTYTRNDIHAVTAEHKDVILLGTSNGKQGIDPDTMLEGTGLTGHNLAAGGEYPVDSYFMAKLAIEKQHPSTVIYEVDPGYFTDEKHFGNNYLLFYHEFPLSRTKAEYFAETLTDGDFRTIFFPFYEYTLAQEVPNMGTTLKRKLSGDYSVDHFKTENMEYHEDGFIERYPVDIADFPAYSPMEFSRDTVLEENVAYMDRLISLCQENDIRFVAVITPLYGGTLQSIADTANEAWDYFSEYFEGKGVDLYNFNREYYKAFSHEAMCFVDYEGHMNGDAARAFSRRLGEILFPQDQGE